jgi:L-threonylcarbamoyladenylate synthase
VITEIVKIKLQKPDAGLIKKAAKIIKNGGLVVLSTDTVYGLACDATNPQAVAKVFYIKQRPLTQPLSIAVSKYRHIYKYVESIPETAKILIKKYLPGPLTIILKKSTLISDIVTAGQNDIGIRIPDCKIVLMLIEYAKVPVVIPSANIHNHPSPTTAQQALKDLNGKVNLILDAGKTKYGNESTIVSCIDNKIKIIRQGVISSKEILSYNL